jgi:hypothetical protein
VILRAGEFHQPRLGVILGEAIHDLRSALDYIIGALAEKSGATLTSGHQFPIFSEKGDYLAKIPRFALGKSLTGFLAEELMHGRPGKRKRAPNVQSP